MKILQYIINKQYILYNRITCVWATIRTTLQYLIIFAKSLSIDLRPRSSCHFLEAFVNAFFLLLYLHKSNYNGCIFANKLGVTASVTC